MRLVFSNGQQAFAKNRHIIINLLESAVRLNAKSNKLKAYNYEF